MNRKVKDKKPSAAKTIGLRAQIKDLRKFVVAHSKKIEIFLLEYAQSTEITLKSLAQSISNLNKVTMEAVVVVQLLLDKEYITREEIQERREEILTKQLEAAKQESPEQESPSQESPETVSKIVDEGDSCSI